MARKNNFEDREYDKEFSPATLTTTARLVSDPDKISKSGKMTMVVFRIAINARTRGRDGRITNKTIFVDTKTFGYTADNILASGLGKGMEVLVSGNLFPDIYENKDGDTIHGLSMVIRDIAPTFNYKSGELDFDALSNYGGGDDDEDDAPRKRSSRSSRSSRSRSRRKSDDDVEDNLEDDFEDYDEDEDDELDPKPRKRSSRSSRASRSSRRKKAAEVDDDVEDYIDDEAMMD